MKKRVRIYKAPDGQGKVMNSTAKWMAQVGGQQQPQVDDTQLTAMIIQMFQQGLEPEEISNQLIQAGIDPQKTNMLITNVYRNLNQQQQVQDQVVREELPMEEAQTKMDMSQYYTQDENEDLFIEDNAEDIILAKGGKVPSKKQWVKSQMKLIKKEAGGDTNANKADGTDTGARAEILQSFVSTVKKNSDDAAMEEYLNNQYDQMQNAYDEYEYLPEAQFGGMRPGQQRRMMRRANKMLGNIPTAFYNRNQGFPGQINLMTGFGATPFAGFAPQSPFFMQGPKLANIDVRRVGLFGKPKEYTINFENQPQFTQNDIQYMIEQEMRNRAQSEKENAEKIKEQETTTSTDNTNVQNAGGSDLPALEDIKVEGSGSGSGSGSGGGGGNRTTPPNKETVQISTEPVTTQILGIDPIDWGGAMEELFADDQRNPRNFPVPDIDFIRRTDPLAMAAPQAAMADDAFWQGMLMPGFKGTGALRLPKVKPKFTFKPGAIPGKGPITPPMFSRPGLPKGHAGYLPKGAIIPPYTGPTPGRIITTPNYIPPGTQLQLPFQEGGYVDPKSGLYKFIYGGNEPFMDYFAQDSKNVNDPYFQDGGLKEYQGDEEGSEVSTEEDNTNQYMTQADMQKFFDNYMKQAYQASVPRQGYPILNQTIPGLYGLGRRGKAFEYAGSWSKQKGLPYDMATGQAYMGPWNNPQLSAVHVGKSDWRGRPKKYRYEFMVDNPNSLANYQPNITNWQSANQGTQDTETTVPQDERSGTRLRAPISGLLRKGPKIWKEQYGPEETFDPYTSSYTTEGVGKLPTRPLEVSERITEPFAINPLDKTVGTLPFRKPESLGSTNINEREPLASTSMLPMPEYNMSEYMDMPDVQPESQYGMPQYNMEDYITMPEVLPEQEFASPYTQETANMVNAFNAPYDPTAIGVLPFNRLGLINSSSPGELIKQYPKPAPTPVASNKRVRSSRDQQIQKYIDQINNMQNSIRGQWSPDWQKEGVQLSTDELIRKINSLSKSSYGGLIKAQDGLANFQYKSPVDWKTVGSVTADPMKSATLDNPFTIDQNWSNSITGESPAITYNPETESYENDLLGEYNENNKIKVAVDQKRKDMTKVDFGKIADDILLYGDMALGFLGNKGDLAKQREVTNRLTSDMLFAQSPNDRGTYNPNTGEQFKDQGFTGIYSAQYGGYMGYKEGGETYMSEEQIREFLANGGEIEFI
jgi:hypothetical protein